ncbi:unnamed protein product [Discula destructiva]
MSSDNEAPSPAKDVVAPSKHHDETAGTARTETVATSEQVTMPVEECAEAVPENEPSPPAQEGQDDAPHTAPSSADSRSEEGEARSDDGLDQSKQGARDGDKHISGDAPPLPNEPTPTGDGGGPPLPTEAPPGQTAATESDDGWSAQWDATNQTWYFYNRFTNVSQWDNPRLTTTAAATSSTAPPIPQPTSIAGGYNPAIHGSWDPNAPYAQAYKEPGADDPAAVAADEAEYQADLAMYNAEMDGSDPTAAAEGFEYASAAALNRRTGRTQAGDQNPERHSDASKSYRQMNAYFNVDQAANSHDGRSLKAERRGKQPTRKELSMWKEKRKARKEEKRRAWLRD